MHRWFVALLCGLILLVPQAALGLGLGEISPRSALNEPFRAQIQLVGATREELLSLEVRLASADTFDRYGLDRPGYLTGLRFQVSRDRGVVEVSSTQPITEPFVTILVEAVWPRGRLLREYTVLLDPPTYAAPAPAAPAPRAAQPAQRGSGTVQRAAPAAAAPAPRTAPQGSRIAGGTDYRVQRNDTLWEIASRVRPAGADINQVMLAIYEANPGAFAGNINLLEAGAVLQLPTAEQLGAVNRRSALEEVRRQNADWRGDAGSLTLVPPDRDAGVGSVASDTRGSAASGATGSGDAALRAELAAAERQLALRNAELARLREQLAAQRAAEAAAAAQPETSDPVVAADPVVEETPPEEPDALYGEDAQTPAQGDGTEVFAETGGPDAAAEDQPETVASEEDTTAPAATRPATATPAVVTTPSGADEGLVDKILGSYWTYIGGGVVAMLGLLGFLAARRNQASDSTGTWEALDAADLEDLDGTLAATGRLRDLTNKRPGGDTVRTPADPALAAAADDPMEQTAPVDDTVVPPPATATPATNAPVSTSEFNLEDTFSSDTAINLDQSDPLAEADFHMAYGLFDQAADLVNGAIAVDGSDVRLKEKLCEIYFQWGKQDGFVAAAQDLRNSLKPNDPAWNSVLIMGQQLAPAHELFSGAVVSDAAGLDLSLDDAPDGDIDAQLDPSGPATGAFEEVFEGGSDDGGTVEQLADISGIDFEFDESIASLGTGEDTVDAALAATGAHETALADFGADDDPNAATGELDFTPPGGSGDTIEQPLDIGARPEAGATAEIDLDDLDLDTGDISALTDTASDVTAEIGADLLDATGVTSVLADDFKVDLPAGDDPDATMLADTSQSAIRAMVEEGTSEMPALDLGGNGALLDGDVDLDVGDLTSELRVDDINATQEQPFSSDSPTRFSEEVFAGDADSEADTGLNLALDEDGGTNIGEVGTKLDLARAYVDMGDPEGARSILDEVMTEGDATQREEAQRLLESIGA